MSFRAIIAGKGAILAGKGAFLAGKGAILAGMQLDNSATLACRAILADLCCILAFFQCMLVRVWLEIFFIDRACHIGLGVCSDTASSHRVQLHGRTAGCTGQAC